MGNKLFLFCLVTVLEASSSLGCSETFFGHENITVLLHTDQMADYMQVCEIVISKPGDLSSTETAVEQLLIPDNANLLMQHQRTALSPQATCHICDWIESAANTSSFQEGLS